MESPRESLFSSAFRTFLRMSFGIFGICIALLVFSFIFSFFSTPSLTEEKTNLSLLPDANGQRELLAASTPVVLQIPIHGVIGTPREMDAERIENILLDSRGGLLSGNRVKAILLDFNTPGGTVTDSEDIYHMLKVYKERYKVPIFGYVNGLCASGGMYIASAASEVYSSPAGIIGSVGVRIGPFFNFYETMQKIGVSAETVTAGLDKDMMSPVRPWKKNESATFQALTDFMYQRFVDVVTSARPKLNKYDLIHDYGAKVFDPLTAERLGFIDHAMTTRDDALIGLLKEANLDPEKPYQVVSLAPKHPFFADLISGKSPIFTGKIEHVFDSTPANIREQPCYLYRYE